MNWKDIGLIVAKATPLLGTAVDGPVGLVAGAAGSLVASFLGCDESPKAVEQGIRHNFDAILKLKKFEASEMHECFNRS